MATVRAKDDCYLGSEHGGFKSKGEEFEYSGPKHDSLVTVGKADADDDDVKYHAYTRDQLKAELDGRGIEYASNAQDKTLRGLLEADDAK